MVVVWKYDRFSRMQEQQPVAIYQLKQYGVEVVSATEPLGTGPEAVLMRSLYAFKAEQELNDIRLRTYRGRKRRIKDNKLPAMGAPLYGYEWKDSTKAAYVIDDQTAWVVRFMYAQILAGEKLRAIAQKLTSDGVPTPSAYRVQRGRRQPSPTDAGTSWTHTRIQKMLVNPAYSGRAVGFRRQKQSITKVHPVTGEDIVVDRYVVREETHPDRVVYGEDVCPALVSVPDFDAVQAVLKQNKVDSTRNIRNPEGALLRNGFAYCGYCGAKMNASYGKARDKYFYRCSQGSQSAQARCPEGQFMRIAPDMDEMMWRAVMAVFSRPEIVRAKIEEYKADKAEGQTIENDRLSVLATLLQEAEKRRRLNTSLASNEEDDSQRAEYAKIATDASRSIKAINQEIEDLNRILAGKNQADEALDRLTALGDQVLERLATANFDERRRTLLSYRSQTLHQAEK